MKYFPLHLKTAVLASLISFSAMSVGFLVYSGKIASQVQNEQEQLAELHADNLADHLGELGNQYDKNDLKNLANLVSGSRPNLSNVRVWRISDNELIEEAASDDSDESGEMNEEIEKRLLAANGRVDLISTFEFHKNGNFYHVFAPIIANGKTVGAVEAVEKLDSTWTIAARYGVDLWWILLVTLGLMSGAFYLLFQKLVYFPLEKLLGGMQSAREGNLAVEIRERKSFDEFGKLSNNFNSMMLQIREMSKERDKQNEILQAKVEEATAELVKQNEQLETANLELFRASRRMSEMERLAAAGQTAAEFAHEVGTPLNIISGHAQLLKLNVPADGKDGQRLDLITEQIERIEKIVRSMLDRTRFGKTEFRSLSVNELLEKVCSAVEPTLEERGIKLVKIFAPDLPPISGDGDRLQQVVLNLFNNSLDVMKNNGEITVSTSGKGEKVFVGFADNGSGMNETVTERIFKPLFTTKERGRGTGLGLTIVKQILDEHAAQISVESNPGKGTKFQIVFNAEAQPQNTAAMHITTV